MIASVVMQKKYVEFELPFLFKYQLDKHFSLFGGMSFTFGKVVGLSNSLQTLSGLKFIDTVLNSKDSFVGTVPLKYEHPNTLNISKYKPTEEKSVSPIRFGYTIGVSYLINRVVVDLSIQQNLSRLNSISDADIRKLYTQPYYRLSLGYNMFTNRKK
jgi:hypothetical protein